MGAGRDPERWAPIDVLATRADADLPATPFTVDAELVATTAVPPDFDYRACLAVYTWRVTSGAPGLPVGRELHVLHPVIEEYTPTDVAAWRAGARARLELDAAEAHVDLEAEAWMSDVEGSPTLLYPTSAVRD